MNKNFKLQLLTSLTLFSCIFSGCIKDTCNRTYTYSYFVPVYKTTAQVKADIKSNGPTEIQNPGKIFNLGNYIFLNEIDKGIHVINNINPASPKNIAFINIPGNMDLAVKGNTLYADLYTDLVTIDITNPLNVVVKKYNEGVFPYRYYSNNFSGDSSKVIVDWKKKDTTVTEECGGGSRWLQDVNVFYMASASSSNGSSKSSVSPVGIGGSMARFAIVNNRMYTVSDGDVNVFNISSPENPVYVDKTNISNRNIETIFPFKNKLFIGSQNGMFMFNINNPDKPSLAGQFAHVQSCDPIIADDKYAYVTLRSGTTCQGFTNQLDILQLNNLTDPKLLESYDFINPHGLAKDGNLLFICDGVAGLKVYDASEPTNLTPIKAFADLETYDVIAANKIALIVAKDGLYQYDYADINNIHLISKINILK